MDTIERKNILSTLALGEQDDASKALLEQEAVKIKTAFEKETDYKALEGNIELLGAIAFRVPDQAVLMVSALIDRLPTLELTFPDAEALGITRERMLRYSNSASLTSKLLSLLRGIRYHEPDQIFDIFLARALDKDPLVSKEAENGLKDLAGYHIDIFYSDGAGWPGLGNQPQERIIDKLVAFSPEKITENFRSIITLCSEILSPMMDESDWSYNKVTIRSGAVPPTPEVKQVRKKTIDFIASLYKQTLSDGQKISIIGTLLTAGRFPHMVKFGDDVISMIAQNTVSVLGYFAQFARVETSLMVLQKLENRTFWEHKRSNDKPVRDAALAVKDIIDANEEYQDFKVLIGFEGVFESWQPEPSSQEARMAAIDADIKKAEAARTQRMHELADQISAANIELWTSRILKYSKIKSDDMATFPFFARFLERFSKREPTLALSILEPLVADLGFFATFLMKGVWESDKATSLRDIIIAWIAKGKYLPAIVALFDNEQQLNFEILEAACKKAVEIDDRKALVLIVSAVISKYDRSRQKILNSVVFEAISALNQAKDYSWPFNVWFRREFKDAVLDMDEKLVAVLLNSLVQIPKIGHEIEEVLRAIATKYPQKVIGFFVKRLSIEAEAKRDSDFEAVPYQFHVLQGVLSENVESLVDTVATLYDGNYGLFIHRGAKLVANIFPDFSGALQEKLISLVKNGSKHDLYVVLAILRNYRGDFGVQNVCSEIVKGLDRNAKELIEVRIILQSTGAVSGEFGLAEAWEQKVADVEPWLSDPNQKVREFAKDYIEGLRQEISRERSRSEERIMVRKAQYGELE